MAQSKKTAREMYPLIETYLDDRMTQKAFCREHDLSLSKLNYWLAKYRREAAEEPVAFMEITPRPLSTEQALLEVVYPHGVRLRLFSPVEPAYLGRLIALNALDA